MVGRDVGDDVVANHALGCDVVVVGWDVVVGSAVARDIILSHKDYGIRCSWSCFSGNSGSSGGRC